MIFQKAARSLPGITRPRIGPRPAFVVSLAGVFAFRAIIVFLDDDVAVIATWTIRGNFEFTRARFDHAGTAHARDAAITCHASRHAAFQPAHAIVITGWVTETP